MADIDLVERLLCERYNVRSIDGLGTLPEAIAAAREGDLAPLGEALAGRELYHWGSAIRAALVVPSDGSRDEPVAEPEPEPATEPEREEPAVAPEEPESEPEEQPEADEPPPTSRRRSRN